MQKGPKVFIAPQNNMTATPAIAAIRAAKCSKFVSEKMPAARAPVPASAKYFYQVNKI
jgi:hypothetical protein